MIDLVYPLGKESVWGNKELMFSLRSVEKYLTGYRNIYIIGEKPLWLKECKEVKFIYFTDKHKNKATNIMAKFMRAAIENELSDNFLFMNDDYFFCGATDTKEFFSTVPYKKTLEESLAARNNKDYLRHLQFTYEALKQKGNTTLNFDLHTPVVMNKNSLIEIVNQYDWNVPSGYILRSTYFNSIPGLGYYKRDDVKINHPYTEAQWDKVYKELGGYFSIGDNAITHGFKKFMEKQFPQKSKYEQ